MPLPIVHYSNPILRKKGAKIAVFDAALARFGSFEVRAEYAIWAVSSGDTATASRLKADLPRARAIAEAFRGASA